MTERIQCVTLNVLPTLFVRRWVDEGKPVDARDNTQKTPLHYAAQWGQEEALDFLIECGADVNAADFIEDTPLHLVSTNRTIQQCFMDKNTLVLFIHTWYQYNNR